MPCRSHSFVGVVDFIPKAMCDTAAGQLCIGRVKLRFGEDRDGLRNGERGDNDGGGKAGTTPASLPSSGLALHWAEPAGSRFGALIIINDERSSVLPPWFYVVT